MVVVLIVSVASAAQAQSPMFVLDGVRSTSCESGAGAATGVKAALANIDRDAIENIEIVKGPAAARTYGAGAAEGVVSITTVKGAIVSAANCTARMPAKPMYIVDGIVVGQVNGAVTGAKPGDDPFARYLYPPELVMSHQDAIALTDRQRSTIQELVKELQAKVLDVQMKLAANGEKLSRALAAASVDESSVLQQIDQVLAAEREIKRAQVTLLVRIKNQLTPAQQGILDKMR